MNMLALETTRSKLIYEEFHAIQMYCELNNQRKLEVNKMDLFCTLHT